MKTTKTLPLQKIYKKIARLNFGLQKVSEYEIEKLLQDFIGSTNGRDREYNLDIEKLIVFGAQDLNNDYVKQIPHGHKRIKAFLKQHKPECVVRKPIMYLGEALNPESVSLYLLKEDAITKKKADAIETFYDKEY